VALEYVPVHRVVGCADPQRDGILYPRCLDPNRFLFSSQACRCDRDHSANTELVMMETQTVQNAHCLVPKNYSLSGSRLQGKAQQRQNAPREAVKLAQSPHSTIFSCQIWILVCHQFKGNSSRRRSAQPARPEWLAVMCAPMAAKIDLERFGSAGQ
jgi:hypothetical protein